MPLEGFGRLYSHAKGKVVLYLPAGVVKDSAFPFKPGSRVRVRILRDTLVVERPRA